MIGVFTELNWTEIIEGAGVSLIFVLVPLGWRMEVHARRAKAQREQHHAEVMEAHRKIQAHLE